MEIKARIISRGKATGPALITKEPIGFLGGIDPETGDVIEKGHELEGQNVSGKVLIFPNGKGSTVGSYVMLQLAKNGKAPAAIINVSAEPIIAVGAIISKIPMVDKPETGNSILDLLKRSFNGPLVARADQLETENRTLITVDAEKGLILLP
jgi:predicted aconitase with swiveling domain